MSRARGNKKRFGYLAGAAGAEASEVTNAGRPEGEAVKAGEEARGAAAVDANMAEPEDGRRGGEEAAKDTRGRSSRPRRTPAARKAAEEELESVPKGNGRMKQERSQLNVRIPTTLKRRAAAKATLEGRDIGGVVEELLRGYLEK
ncbi:MAG: hypothetical protein M3P49_02465 [Actinomycetota bacterium]|nr:hypothetical protein [Actinomycetota bacterium]